MIITQLAILLAGGAFVPIDPTFPPHRIAYIMHDSQSSFVIARGGDLSKITQAMQMDAGCEDRSSTCGTEQGAADRKTAMPPHVSPVCIDVIDIIDVDVKDLAVDVTVSVDQGRSAQEHDKEGGEGRDEAEGSEGKAICWIYYTSGSTGQPKGVLCEHESAAAYLKNHPLFATDTPNDDDDDDADTSTQTHDATLAGTQVDTNAHDSKRQCCSVVGNEHGHLHAYADRQLRVLVPSSFTFDPSAGDIFGTLAHGGVLCVAPRAAMLADLGGCLASFGVTHVCSTPAVWRTVTHEPGELALRVVALGGEPMSDAVVARWAGAVKLLNLYGTTEATVYQVMHRMREGDSPKLLGTPLPGMHLAIVAADATIAQVEQACQHAHDTLAVGAQGELVQLGTQVARGYAGRPLLSAAKFGLCAPLSGGGEGGAEGVSCRDKIRFYRTGDIVEMTEQGLKYVGRRDMQVKVLGVRCELGEIETVLRACPLVHEAVVTLESSNTHTQGFVELVPEVAAAAHDVQLRAVIHTGARYIYIYIYIYINIYIYIYI